MAPNENSRENAEAMEGSPDTPEVFVEVDIKSLPTFSKLNEQVQKLVRSSSWWEKYGVDWMHVLVITSTVPFALSLLKQGSFFGMIVATLLLGAFHCIVANKAGHIATHGAMVASKRMKKVINIIATEFIGSYSCFMANYIHVDIHHPYTNIIGLGDSSSWKAPFLGRTTYLFLAPLILPFLTPIIAMQQLVEMRRFKELLQFTMIMLSGLACHILVLIKYANFSGTAAFFYLFTYRAVFAVPYIHLNIFQHIGLPMYSQKAKPVRLYQMSTGVLNLSRNVVLDYVMGHSLINCHVEHHLFSRLSDNMCLKIKPLVRSFLKEHGLPYHEDSYMNRLRDFYTRYDELMVKAPPITHFVGLQ